VQRVRVLEVVQVEAGPHEAGQLLVIRGWDTLLPELGGVDFGGDSAQLPDRIACSAADQTRVRVLVAGAQPHHRLQRAAQRDRDRGLMAARPDRVRNDHRVAGQDVLLRGDDRAEVRAADFLFGLPQHTDVDRQVPLRHVLAGPQCAQGRAFVVGGATAAVDEAAFVVGVHLHVERIGLRPARIFGRLHVEVVVDDDPSFGRGVGEPPEHRRRPGRRDEARVGTGLLHHRQSGVGAREDRCVVGLAGGDRGVSHESRQPLPKPGLGFIGASADAGDALGLGSDVLCHARSQLPLRSTGLQACEIATNRADERRCWG